MIKDDLFSAEEVFFSPADSPGSEPWALYSSVHPDKQMNKMHSAMERVLMMATCMMRYRSKSVFIYTGHDHVSHFLRKSG